MSAYDEKRAGLRATVHFDTISTAAWLPEPDDGDFFMPSRLVCQQFAPCTEGGCEGDPHPDTRAAITAEVRRYWQTGGEA